MYTCAKSKEGGFSMGIKWELFDEYLQRKPNRLYTIGEFIFDYLILLPLKIIFIVFCGLKALTIVLPVIGIHIFKEWLDIFDGKAHAPYLGFRDGLTPFSSWHNFGLYALALGVSMAVILSIKAYFKVKDENSDDPKEKLYYRLCIGYMVNNIRKIAVAFLTVFLVLTVIKYLHTPFPTWIMGLNLMCLGIIFGYDNRKHSVDGVKYGYLGSRRAVEQLADELHLSHDELAQKISKR